MENLTRSEVGEMVPVRWNAGRSRDGEATIGGRCRALQARLERHDPGSEAHAAAVGRISAWLAWRATGSASLTSTVAAAAPFHDVGKLLVASAVLHKPAGLDAEEWRIMRRHADAGRALLVGCGLPDGHPAVRVAAEHHERFDGAGYPHGLRGARISLEARIVSLADVFDALLSRRCYKPSWSLSRVVDYLQQQRGGAFDPELVDVLLSAPEQALLARGCMDEISGDAQEPASRFAPGRGKACDPVAACLQAA